MQTPRAKILTFPNGDTLSADLICGVRDCPACKATDHHSAQPRRVQVSTRTGFGIVTYHYAEGDDATLDDFRDRAIACHHEPWESAT